MSLRQNIFVVHSWDEWPTYERLIGLLRAREAGLADYSVPPWKALDGHHAQVLDGIDGRLSSASAVLVLNTPGLHNRPISAYEMTRAAEMGKRIIVVQPHGEFRRPIPAALDAHLYRVAPWRSDVLGRAIRGEYPLDGRVFDIAEMADRRALSQILAAGVGFASFAILVSSAVRLNQLSKELAGQGTRIEWTGEASRQVLGGALFGAGALGLVTYLVTEDPQASLAMAAAGGLGGAAFCTYRVYKTALEGTSNLRILTVEHS